MKDFINYIYTFAYDIVIWPIILIMYALWGKDLHWHKGIWFRFKEDSWPMRTWYKKWAGTTLGHGGFLSSNVMKGIEKPTDVMFAATTVMYHEQIHVEQFRANMLRHFMMMVFVSGFLVGAGMYGSAALLGGIIWFLGGLFYIPNWMVAKLQGEEMYMGSTHEESAYAQTKINHKQTTE